MNPVDHTYLALSEGRGHVPINNPVAMQLLGGKVRNNASSADAEIRKTALRIAVLMGPDYCIDLLDAFATDPDVAVRREIFQRAMDAGPGGVRVCRKMMADSDPAISIRAIELATEASDKSSTSRMRTELGSKNAMVRAKAAIFLAYNAGPALSIEVARLKTDSDEHVRNIAVWAVQKLDEKTDEPPPTYPDVPKWAPLALPPLVRPEPPPTPVASPLPMSTYAPVSAQDTWPPQQSAPAAPPPSQPQHAAPAPTYAQPVAQQAPRYEPPPQPLAPPPPESDRPPATADFGSMLWVLQNLARLTEEIDDLVARTGAREGRELVAALDLDPRDPLTPAVDLWVVGLARPPLRETLRRVLAAAQLGQEPVLAKALGRRAVADLLLAFVELSSDTEPRVRYGAVAAAREAAERLGLPDLARKAYDAGVAADSKPAPK